MSYSIKKLEWKMNWNTNEKQNESGSKIENQNGIEDRNRKSKAAIENRNRNYKKKTEGL